MIKPTKKMIEFVFLISVVIVSIFVIYNDLIESMKTNPRTTKLTKKNTVEFIIFFTIVILGVVGIFINDLTMIPATTSIITLLSLTQKTKRCYRHQHQQRQRQQ